MGLNTLNTHHPCPYSAQITALCCATRSRCSVLQFTLNKDLACLARNLCGLGNFYAFTQCDSGPRFLVVHPDRCSRKTVRFSQSRTVYSTPHKPRTASSTPSLEKRKDSLHDILRDGANFATMDKDGRAEGIVILCPTSSVQRLEGSVPIRLYPDMRGVAGSVTVLQRRHMLVRSGPNLFIINA
ncbi:hypothetical protein BDW22DRAFT_1361583 [Trametopsis cervina]|nr:hypothetical protein BDW22DRAFT_1361583 [Trametopsis cervina]